MTLYIEPFSAGYYLISGVEVVGLNLQEGERPGCDPLLFQDLQHAFGSRLRARVGRQAFDLKPVQWAPEDTVVFDKGASTEEDPPLLLQRPGSVGAGAVP